MPGHADRVALYQLYFLLVHVAIFGAGFGSGQYSISPDGRYLQVNRAFCKIVGYSEEELLALDFQTITHPEDLGADLDAADAGDLARPGEPA